MGEYKLAYMIVPPTDVIILLRRLKADMVGQHLARLTDAAIIIGTESEWQHLRSNVLQGTVSLRHSSIDIQMTLLITTAGFGVSVASTQILCRFADLG